MSKDGQKSIGDNDQLSSQKRRVMELEWMEINGDKILMIIGVFASSLLA